MLTIESAYIKHKGMLVDKSTKIELILPELTPDEAAVLYSMINNVIVDLIIVPAGSFSLIKDTGNLKLIENDKKLINNGEE